MLIRSQTTILLQIFCEPLVYYRVIIKSMQVADDTFLWKSEYEWVKDRPFHHLCSTVLIRVSRSTAMTALHNRAELYLRLNIPMQANSK